MTRQSVLEVRSPGRGLHEISSEVARAVQEAGISTGVCHLFVLHTSASLLVQENADPSARRDLERWFEREIVDGDPFWSHRAEGPDDMPAHVRAALTATTLSLPIREGRLRLGTWQGVYLFEHRRGPHRRSVVATIQGEPLT